MLFLNQFMYKDKVLTEIVQNTERGSIIFDNTIFEEVSQELFSPSHWLHSKKSSNEIGGRGNVYFLNDGDKKYVLRHYFRGGLASKLSYDSYLWLGENKTRSFREWRLLKFLYDKNLPVPRPAAANYQKNNYLYKADIITLQIPEVQPLATFIAEKTIPNNFWCKLGYQIANFHFVGLFHADLNAFNIQIDKSYKSWLIDFDKGSIREPGRWEQSNLNRLKASLEKISGNNPKVSYSDFNWNELNEGYAQFFRSA